jgi:hypothetical protein
MARRKVEGEAEVSVSVPVPVPVTVTGTQGNAKAERINRSKGRVVRSVFSFRSFEFQLSANMI